MTTEEFTNTADGLINDFTHCLISDRQFRSGMLDLLLAVAMPHLEGEPVAVTPGFSTITSIIKLRAVLESIDQVDDLNELREVVLGYNKRKDDHPLRDGQYGFALVFNSLDKRASELGFIKYSSGYRDPKKQQK